MLFIYLLNVDWIYDFRLFKTSVAAEFIILKRLFVFLTSLNNFAVDETIQNHVYAKSRNKKHYSNCT